MIDFKTKPILGMIHLSGAHVIDRAKRELEIFLEEGVNGAIIENYHADVPTLMNVLNKINWKDYSDLYLGINVLPNDYELALYLASQHNFDFIQLDHIAGTYQNNLHVNMENYLKVKEKYPNIQVLGGVWPKYYQPIEGSIIENDLDEAMALCDAIVVTGEGTGKQTPLEKIKLFKDHIKNFPLIIGAGLDACNAEIQLEHADGGIVGSCFKPYGRTQEQIKKELVAEFMKSFER